MYLCIRMNSGASRIYTKHTHLDLILAVLLDGLLLCEAHGADGGVGEHYGRHIGEVSAGLGHLVEQSNTCGCVW